MYHVKATTPSWSMTSGTPKLLPQPAVTGQGGNGEVIWTVDNPAANEDLFLVAGAAATDWTAVRVASGATTELPVLAWPGSHYLCMKKRATFTFAGNDDGDYTITIAGVAHTYTAAGKTTQQIRDGVLALLVASSDMSAKTAIASGTDAIVVEAARPVISFTSATAVPPAPATATITTAVFAGTVTISPRTQGVC